MSEVAAKVDNLGWTERFNNLKKRFPGVKDEEILKALELHKGHAGGWWVPHPAVFGVKVSRGGAVRLRATERMGTGGRERGSSVV